VSFRRFKLSLTRFEARVRLADYVDTSFAANYLAVRVTVFERFERRYNFHNEKRENGRKKGSPFTLSMAKAEINPDLSIHREVIRLLC
jgi:hypothetical protein